MPQNILEGYEDVVRAIKNADMPEIASTGFTKEWVKKVLSIDNGVNVDVDIGREFGGSWYETYHLKLWKKIHDRKIVFMELITTNLKDTLDLLDDCSYEDMVWTEDSIKWTDDAQKHLDYYRKDFAEDELKKMDEVELIAKIKGFKVGNRKEETIDNIIVMEEKTKNTRRLWYPYESYLSISLLREGIKGVRCLKGKIRWTDKDKFCPFTFSESIMIPGMIEGSGGYSGGGGSTLGPDDVDEQISNYEQNCREYGVPIHIEWSNDAKEQYEQMHKIGYKPPIKTDVYETVEKALKALDYPYIFRDLIEDSWSQKDWLMSAKQRLIEELGKEKAEEIFEEKKRKALTMLMNYAENSQKRTDDKERQWRDHNQICRARILLGLKPLGLPNWIYEFPPIEKRNYLIFDKEGK